MLVAGLLRVEIIRDDLSARDAVTLEADLIDRHHGDGSAPLLNRMPGTRMPEDHHAPDE